jgi:hypothetical protein
LIMIERPQDAQEFSLPLLALVSKFHVLTT